MSTVAYNEEGRGDMTTETQVVPDTGELSQIKEVEFQEDRLVFYGELTDDLIERISAGLAKFHKGRQFFWGDFWAKLRDSGYEWTDHVPHDSSDRPIISLSRANTWLMVRDKFRPEDRIYKNLRFSHYEAVRSIDTGDAHALLNAADGSKISVQELEEVVRGMKDKPEKPKKLKVIDCPHCDRPAFEDVPCTGCMLDVATKEHRKTLEDIKYGEQAPPPPEWVIEICDRALGCDEIT